MPCKESYRHTCVYCCCLSGCSRPSQVRRNAFTRSPLKKSSSSDLSRIHTPVASSSKKFTSPVENLNKTSAASVSESPATVAKKRLSVDKTTPRPSQTKNLTSDSVTVKLSDHLSARKSAAEPQVSSRSEKNLSVSKQKTVAGQSHHSRVLDVSPRSSRKTSESFTKKSMSGTKTAEDGTDHSGQKSTEMAVGLKGKGPKLQSPAKVTSARQPMSTREDSRPASRVSVYVSLPTLVGKSAIVKALIMTTTTSCFCPVVMFNFRDFYCYICLSVVLCLMNKCLHLPQSNVGYFLCTISNYNARFSFWVAYSIT